MASIVKTHKYVNQLPLELEADSIYYVKKGTGFDIYVTNSSGIIVPYTLNAPSSSEITYTNSNPVPATLGGIQSGSTFDKKPISDVLNDLLYPYQAPSFTSFSISGQSSPIEVGSSVQNNVNFIWGISNNINMKPNSISIIDVTNSNTILKSNLVNDGSEAITLNSLSKNTATSHTFRIQSTNSKDNVFSRDYTINWQWRKYYGESILNNLTDTDVKLLRVSNLSNSFAGTYSFSGGGYKYIAYPSSLGLASVFKDQSTNLSVPMLPVSIIPITNILGITTNYNVHRTTNILGGAINIIVS